MFILDKMLLIDLETQSFSVESGIYEVACLVVENFEVIDKLYLGKKYQIIRAKEDMVLDFTISVKMKNI